MGRYPKSHIFRRGSGEKCPRKQLSSYPTFFSKPICKALREYQRDHPHSTQKMIKEWLLNEHKTVSSLSVISQILNISSVYLSDTDESDEEDEPSDGSASGILSDPDELEDEQSDGPVLGTLSDPIELKDEQDDGSNLVTLSDPEVLDCPICLDFTIPIHQCENGHVACSSCCSKIQEKCPSCSLPIRLNRCQFIEKVLEAANISCANRKYGCQHMSKYGNKQEHDKICLFSPCECPESSCNFVSSSSKLYSHFSSCHKFSRQDFSLDQYISVTLEKGQRNLVLSANGENIFLLNNFSETDGSAIELIRIAQLHHTVRFSYDIKVRYEEAFIKLHSSVENIPKWCADHHPGKKFILVPHYCVASNGQLHLELRINSKTKDVGSNLAVEGVN